MKIYIITKGEYSDYHICAVTTNSEQAKRLQKIYSDNWSEAGIETYEDNATNKGLTLYECRFYRATNKYTVEPDEYHYQGKIGYLYSNGNVLRKNYEMFIYAKDEDHAQKIFQDKIAEYKAKQENII